MLTILSLQSRLVPCGTTSLDVSDAGVVFLCYQDNITGLCVHTGYQTLHSFPSNHGGPARISNSAASGYLGHALHCYPGEGETHCQLMSLLMQSLSLQSMLKTRYAALPCLTSLYLISRGVAYLHRAKCFSTDKTHRAHCFLFGHIFH